MNINYINESVISVAVMKREHTHIHTLTHSGPTGREGSVWKMFVVFLQSYSSLSGWMRNGQTISERMKSEFCSWLVPWGVTVRQ